MQNKSFPLKWNDSIEEANKVQSDETWLWHKRYGHYNIGALKLIHQRDIVRDLPLIYDVDSLCEACQLGKQHRKPFPTESTWRAKEKLELVHTDICGPHRTLSLNRNKYFILFIDDFTQMT